MAWEDVENVNLVNSARQLLTQWQISSHHYSRLIIFYYFQLSLEGFKCHLGWSGLSACCWMRTNTHSHAHGPKRQSPTDNRTQGRCFGQCFHSQIPSQDFAELVSSHFPGSQIQLQAKGLTQKHTCVYILLWRRHIQLHSMWTLKKLTIDSYKKVKLKHQRQRKKQIRVMTSQNEGAATVKAPLFWFVFYATHTCRHTPIITYLHNTAYHTPWQLEKAFTVIASWWISLQITSTFHPISSEKSNLFPHMHTNKQTHTHHMKHF